MFEQVQDSEKIRALTRALGQNDSLLIEELWNSPKALIAALAQKTTGKHVLILTGASGEENKLFHDLPQFTKRPVVEFPAWETLPAENIPPSPDIVGERYQVLHSVKTSKEPLIIITNLQACLQKLIEPKQFENLYVSLKQGDSCGFETLIGKLENMGYTRCPVASDKGEFAVRGGIVDLYPVSSPDPFRLEFWGDEIESIRLFDPVGQKSVKQVKEVEITPAQEMELANKSDKLSTILEYLGKDTVVIFDDLLALEDKYASLIKMCGQNIKTFATLDELMQLLEKFQKIFFSKEPIEELSEVKTESRQGYYSEKAPYHTLIFEMFNRELTAKRVPNPFFPIAHFFVPDKEEVTGDDILTSVTKLSKTDFSLHFLCDTEREEESLHKLILEKNIKIPEKTSYHIGYLSSGFVIPDAKLILVPMTEITKKSKIRRQKLRSTYHTVPSQMFDIAEGEMVVHLNQGIGRYKGIEKRKNNVGIESEFFTIEYAQNAKLYVPLNQTHLISKYIGSHDEVPKLHTLGSTRWSKTKERTETAILGYASELLRHYAKRQMKGGFSYPEDSPDLLEFEEEFPFVESEDQLQAIFSVKEDMKSGKPMDRLVCGDVGYGKTEVAMRAAFKAVIDGKKQVAMLVPTTVLALQHYENFVERMRNFSINIALLSRFRTPSQMKRTTEEIAKGKIDIVIGTHRLISSDVSFKNLGLIIIDEEQRFGVQAKEHLKKLKTGVDCLTLSATPIPRTLYMSLIGARDMSVINTPPQDRLPIKTIISEPHADIIKNAILRELNRDGQVFIIHNRVNTIHSMADKIKKMVPQARVIVGHGQMSTQEIDTVFHAFKSGKADILIATTIVESGIDIPNANTILIDRSDQFGMADLYQLRGRVGRWNRRAYAYFLVPKLGRLPEIARKRLNALAEASGGYGGGMKIAMRDLEIRGAGDILGTEQSGHVSAIGFYLYCKLLKRTIQALQGEFSLNYTDTKLDHDFDARLPEDYVNATELRMELYQRLGDAMTNDDVDTIFAEIKDRFGTSPEPVNWLYHLTRIRVFASMNGYAQIKIENGILTTKKKIGNKVIENKVGIPRVKSPKLLEEIIIQKLQKQK